MPIPEVLHHVGMKSLLISLILLSPASFSSELLAAPEARPFGQSRHEYELRIQEERERRNAEEQALRAREFERDLSILREYGKKTPHRTYGKLPELRNNTPLFFGIPDAERFASETGFSELQERSFAQGSARIPVRRNVCASKTSEAFFEKMTSGMILASVGDFRSSKTPKMCGIYISKPLNGETGGRFSIRAVSVKVWTGTGRLAYDVMTLDFDAGNKKFRAVSRERFDACGTKLPAVRPESRWIPIKKGTLSGDILRCVDNNFIERHSRAWYGSYFRSVLSGKSTKAIR